MSNQKLNTETKDADKPELHELACSKLGQLGAERHADLMSYLPTMEKFLGDKTEWLEKVQEDGYEYDTVMLNESQARWLLSCLAFVATLPKYLDT